MQSKRSQSKGRRDKTCPGPKNHKPKSQSPKIQRSKWPKSKQSQPKNRQSQARSSPKRRVQKGHGTKSWQDKVRFSHSKFSAICCFGASLLHPNRILNNLCTQKGLEQTGNSSSKSTGKKFLVFYFSRVCNDYVEVKFGHSEKATKI